VRLGFEDQVELEPGRLAASNAELVERAARLGEIAGRAVATPQRAREILGLAA
jgi:3-keto-5-aminohexanoate cleavage enzyme